MSKCSLQHMQQHATCSSLQHAACGVCVCAVFASCLCQILWPKGAFEMKSTGNCNCPKIFDALLMRLAMLHYLPREGQLNLLTHTHMHRPAPRESGRGEAQLNYYKCIWARTLAVATCCCCPIRSLHILGLSGVTLHEEARGQCGRYTTQYDGMQSLVSFTSVAAAAECASASVLHSL